MQKLINLNAFLLKAWIVITIIGVLIGLVNLGKSAVEFNQIGADATPDEEQKMIAVMAQRDGETDTTPYTQLVNQLDEVCVENPTQIVGIAATLVKKLQQDGFEDYTHKEALEELLYSASEDNQTASCFNTYLEMIPSS